MLNVNRVKSAPTLALKMTHVTKNSNLTKGMGMKIPYSERSEYFTTHLLYSSFFSFL